jgi:hypothetical protein
MVRVISLEHFLLLLKILFPIILRCTRMKLAILYSLCFFVLLSYDKGEQMSSPILPDSESSELLRQMIPEIKTFELLANRDTMIAIEEYTYIFIPHHSFQDYHGSTVTGFYTFSVIDIKGTDQMLRAGMHTANSESIMQCAGMWYTNAEQNNSPLQLREDKKLYFELVPITILSYKKKLEIYSGKYDDGDKIDWVYSSSLEKEMLPFPLDSIHWAPPQCFRIIPNLTDEFPDITCLSYDSTLLNDTYQNTFISTFQFKERLQSFRNIQLDLFFNSIQNATSNFDFCMDSTFLNLYLNNTDKPLYFCDSLVRDYILSLPDEIFYNRSISKNGKNVKPFDAFSEYMREKLTSIYSINYSPIDSSGFLKENDTATDVERWAIARINRTRKNQFWTMYGYTYPAFRINKLGWTCCLWGDDTAKLKSLDLKVQIANPDKHKWVKVILTDKYNRLVLEASKRDDHFVFLAPDGTLPLLPAQSSFTVLAYSYDGTRCWYNTEHLSIDSTRVILDLTKSSILGLHYAMNE